MTHAERKSDCKYEVEREGRKRKRMRVRNEGENRLKKPTLKQQKSLLILQKKLPAAQENLSVTHSHTCSSFFLCRLILPFLLSRDLQSSAAAMVCVCRVLAVCVCVCIRVSGNDVLSRTFLGSYILMSRFVVCRCLLYEQRTEVFWDCVSLWRCVCVHTCVCVCVFPHLSPYISNPSVNSVNFCLSSWVFYVCMCTRCYLGINNEDSEDCVKICVLQIFHHEKKNNSIFSLGCHLQVLQKM